MKNAYENCFKINLGSHFILPSVSANTASIPQLLNLEECKLRTLIYSSLIDNFSNYTIKSVNEEATIYADWTSFLNDTKDPKSLSIKIELNTDKDINIEAEKNYLSYYIGVYLYELFLILNLSIQGSVSLFKANFKVDFINTRIDIDNYFFCSSLEWSNEIDWFKILYIPTKDVVTWYNNFKIGNRQISENSLERVIIKIKNIIVHSTTNFVDTRITTYKGREPIFR